VRNEADFIVRSIEAVLAQDWPHDAIEVLVVDGASDDDTAAMASRALASSDVARWEVIDNPERIVPVSMNLGIARARGDVIVRVDGHCEIAPDYVRRSMDALEATGAACVGGVCETVASTPVGRAIAVAQSSRFGVGNVAFRVGRAHAGPVDTVPFGTFRKPVLERVGGYDEELVRNQDDELNFRLVQAGEVVWFDPAIRSRYFSRSDLVRLWRQYFQYGEYKVRVMQKRGGVAAPRQLVPGAFVAALIAGVVAAAATRRPRVLALVVGPYAGANAAASLALARRERVPLGPLAAAFATLHVAYGAGCWAGVWRWRAGFRRARAHPSRPPPGPRPSS
jgi:GT2 family glycosyltransferase